MSNDYFKSVTNISDTIVLFKNLVENNEQKRTFIYLIIAICLI